MVLKQITFYFENCEYITIDGKYIGEFLVDKISASVSRVTVDSVRKMNVSKLFKIEIHKDADVEYCQFGDENYKRKIFERFENYSDITEISFDLEDKDSDLNIHYDYYLNWIGDSSDMNLAQKSYRSNLGNLYIVVAEDEDIFELFDKYYINDENAMKYRFSL